MKKYVADFERPIIELESQLEELKKAPSAHKSDFAREITYLEKQIAKLKVKTYTNLTPWQKVQLARHPERPRYIDYLEGVFSDFTEIHGDRLYGDDRALIGGFAYLDSYRVVVIGTEKGKNTKEKIFHNFGMPHPEGYRKAARLFKLAERFNLPVINFIDTPGAYPGIEAEERGQASAISNNLKILSDLGVPIISTVIGEGGSGGALALGVADRIFMMENAYYSVIAPEGCASILWGDAKKAEKAADKLSLTAEKLLKLKLIDGIVSEPLGGAHHDASEVFSGLKSILLKTLDKLTKIDIEKLKEERYQKLMSTGVYSEKDNLSVSRGIKILRGDSDENRSVN